MAVECLSCLIVDKFICDSCDDVYIGKTVETYKCRVSYHMAISPQTGGILATLVQSDIREHCLNRCSTNQY